MDAAAAERLRKLDEALRPIPTGYNGYENKDRLRRDVADLLRSCGTLLPQSGSFSGSDRKVTLFYLYGTLPISYKGASYNIPVTIYFDPPYPKGPPRCFVTPTGTMAVSKSHDNVDQGGMVYMPCLAQWNARSSLTEMITTMSSIFCEKPPVYSTDSRPSGSPQAGLAGAVGAMSGVLSGFFSSPAEASPARPAAAGYRQPVHPVQPVQPVVAQPALGYHGAHGHHAGGGGYTPAAMPVVAAHVIATPAHAGPSKAALVEQIDTAVKDRWLFVVEPLVDEANAEIDKRRELNERLRQVEEQLDQLKAEEARCQDQVRQLDALEPELRAFVAANEGKEAANPDEIREQLDANSRQVLDLLAEELALDELLVAIDDLLANGKISIEDFMREVRDVSRKRFLCQVLRQKSEATLHNEASSATWARMAAAPAPAAPVARTPVSMPVAYAAVRGAPYAHTA
mmetsp:Transcript_22002/g.56303  ORF Transcript_22002/g.56303 Transcript_22002/m.56303 type:complete len:456 (+) Transcript_22002:91-1458(+)